MKLKVSIVRIIDYDDVYLTEDGGVMTDREAAEADKSALESGSWDLIEFLQETDGDDGSELLFETIDTEEED